MKRHILLEEDRGYLSGHHGATTILVDMGAVEHIGMHSTNRDMYFTSTGQLMPITFKQGIQLAIGMHKAGLLEQEHMELLVAKIEVCRQQIEKERQKDEWETKLRQAQATEALEAALQKIGKPGHLVPATYTAAPEVIAQWERAKALQELQNQATRRDPFNSYDFGSRAGGYGLGTISASSASPMAPAQSEPAEQAPPSESQD